MLHGALHLLPQASPRGLHLPIDFFFRSLAEDQQERSIGVILSGMGSDGTLGLRAIKEKAGAAFVQEPASAKFDGMPRSAIDAGLADVVAPVEELPGEDHRLPHSTRRTSADATIPLEDKAQSALEKVFVLLRAHTGHDFSLYKTQHDLSPHRAAHGPPPDRQHRGLRAVPAGEPARARSAVQGAADRRHQLLPRSAGLGAARATRCIPALLASRPRGGALRAWVPGCSTGEEAYSLAIVFREALEPSRGRARTSRCRSSPPISTPTPSTRRAPGRLSRQHRGRRVAGAPATGSSSRRSAATG